MGNPAILNRHDRTGEASAPALPLRWRVYKLRHCGEKLERGDIIRTEQRGVIKIYDRGNALHAELSGSHGIDLARLEHVRLRRMVVSGAMLLYGSELRQTRREIVEEPQAWWCIPICGEELSAV